MFSLFEVHVHCTLIKSSMPFGLTGFLQLNLQYNYINVSFLTYMYWHSTFNSLHGSKMPNYKHVHTQGKTCFDDWQCNTMWGRGAICEVLYAHVRVAPNLPQRRNSNFSMFDLQPWKLSKKTFSLHHIHYSTANHLQKLLMLNVSECPSLKILSMENLALYTV